MAWPSITTIGSEFVIGYTATGAPILQPPAQATVVNPWSYYAFDLLTGRFLAQLPFRGVSFGQQLNGVGSFAGTLDLQDPRVQATEPLPNTAPNRTFIIADYLGTPQWGGIVLPRKWKVEGSGQSTGRLLEVPCSELWCYFQSRVQATDYSSPPYSGITGDETEMGYWKATPWDASLIACQVISDAIGYTDGLSQPYGNLLNGLELRLNGEVPSGSKPAAPVGDYVAVNYPFASCQLVDTIINALATLGLGVGFDYGVDLAYSGAAPSPPVATINLSYPRRGRSYAENALLIDVTTARFYEVAEDGSQTANQVYEVGGSGAISVSDNIVPLEQGYPLWEKVISRANIQSQNIEAVLGQCGLSDLALYSYAPVTFSVTLATNDPNVPLGSFIVGDDVLLVIPQYAPSGEVFDPRFPQGLAVELRIVAWQAEIADQGDTTVKLSLARPPLIEALYPAI